MTETLARLAKGALNDLDGRLRRDAGRRARRADRGDRRGAKRIVVFGLGREGLQMRGFAMRLFHMGRDVAVWGDMTTPAVGPGDLLFVSAGPGDLATAETLVDIARKAGARTALVTAQPGGELAKPRRRRDRDPRADDGRRSRRRAVGAADGLAVRDRADDLLRARDPEAPPALQRDRGDHAGAAHQPGVIGTLHAQAEQPGRWRATSTSRRRPDGSARW